MTTALDRPFPKKTRLLIVDESLYMRMAIRTMVAMQPDIEIVGEAANGEEAIDQARQLAPDVITMDVNMPGTGGIEATRRIVEQGGPAVIMVSSLAGDGVEATFEALEAGAVDYIPKSASPLGIDLATVAAGIAAKVHFWGQGKGRTASGPAVRPALALAPDPRLDLVLLVSGEGSPQVVREVLCGLGPLTVPVVVAQEMPPRFTEPFVEFLARTTGLTAAGRAAQSRRGHGVVGRQGLAPRRRRVSVRFGCRVARSSGQSLPDRIMTSAAIASHPIAVVLGGPSSCRQGVAALHVARCPVLVQDRASCLIARMPESALATGSVHLEASPERLAGAVRALLCANRDDDLHARPARLS